MPGIPWLYGSANWATIAIELSALLGVLTLISRALYKRNILVRV